MVKEYITGNNVTLYSGDDWLGLDISLWRIMWRGRRARIILQGYKIDESNILPDGSTIEFMKSDKGIRRDVKENNTPIYTFHNIKLTRQWLNLPIGYDNRLLTKFIEYECDIEVANES